MGKRVTFSLGRASGLTERRVTVKRTDVDPEVTVLTTTLQGGTDVVTVDLDLDTLYELKLIDVRGAVLGNPTVFRFVSNEAIPFDSGPVRVLGWEDMSSSSSSSSSSTNSSSSSTSSASSVNSSSSSTSSVNSSSSSASSANSSSSSSTNSSSSSNSSSTSSSSKSSFSSGSSQSP